MNKNEGWICPRCGKVNAPWVKSCDCKKDNNVQVITFDTNTDDEYTGTYKYENGDNGDQMIFS